MSAVLDLQDVVKVFGTRRHPHRAVDGVSLRVEEGSIFGLVGESGSGKTTLARCALHLIEPTSGRAVFEGQELGALSRGQLRSLRSRLGVVFQNPVAALNPRMTIASLVAEPLVTHTKLRGSELKSRVLELLDDVGLGSAYPSRLPHQLSGGQLQRVGIARALATTPRMLILDEPTSALDVSVQAQILNLLRELRTRHDLTYLLISHDLDVIRYMCDSVAVMKQGQIIERGDTGAVFGNPEHEYTRSLLAATPGQRRIR
ncbi:peptide ABC transporter, ATP-binding protein [marine actinobacterium PHSC20C1]|nr:peptide ABC transporter, ATP-binding protein [marine actinobacterium PHSC20C1]